MKKNIKIPILFFILLFVYSCGTAQDALVGKKRSEQGDEFLIDKKNPLSMPPDFDKLPEPGESVIALTNENNQDNESQIKKLLNNNNEESDNSSNTNQSSDIETSIIKKIQ